MRGRVSLPSRYRGWILSRGGFQEGELGGASWRRGGEAEDLV